MTFEVYIDLTIVGAALMVMPLVLLFGALLRGIWRDMTLNHEEKKFAAKLIVGVAVGGSSFVTGLTLLDMHRAQKALEAQQIDRKEQE